MNFPHAPRPAGSEEWEGPRVCQAPHLPSRSPPPTLSSGHRVCYAESLRRVRLFVTPWTVVHQAPLSMGILQARILEWVAMLSSRSGHHGEMQNVVPGSGRAWDCQPTPLGTPVRLVPAVCSPSAPPPLAFQCPECAGGETRASPAVWEDGDCIPPCPHSPTTPGVARDLPWRLVNH